jgi:ATP-dependent RNA helicase DDX41
MNFLEQEENVGEKQREEESKLLESFSQNGGALISVSEMAKGVKYEKSITTSWRPPSHVRHLTKEDEDRLRKKKGITVEGEGVPSLIGKF